MDRLGQRLDRPGQHRQHWAVVLRDSHRRVPDRHRRGELRPVEGQRRLQLPGGAAVPAKAERHAADGDRSSAGGGVWIGVVECDKRHTAIRFGRPRLIAFS